MVTTAVPPSPRGPSPRARAAIFAYQGVGRIGLILSIVFSGVGAVLVLVFGWGLPVDLAIEAGARAGTGRVISSELDRQVRINGRHPTVVRFSYVVEGRVYEGRSSAVRDQLLALREGDEVPIQIASRHPSWARVDGTMHAWAGHAGLILLLLPLTPLLILSFIVRAHRRSIRAFIHGRPATAQVDFAGFDRRYRMKGRNPFRVSWQFQADDGRTYRGSLSAMTPALLEPLATTPDITILYDPANPRANAPYIP